MKMRAIRWLYTYRFLDDFIFIYPLYQLMFVAHGLSLVQISWLFVIWSASSILIEVPTGVLADRYSRRNLLALGQVIKAAGFACWLVLPNFWGYALGFVLWSLGASFHSGTFEALIYDELKLIGMDKFYVKVKGRAESLGLTGNLIATAAASLAISLGYNGVLRLSILAVILAALVAYLIPEAPRQEAVGDTGYFADLREGISQALHNPAILRIILLGGFMGALFGALEEYTPIFLSVAGASLQAVPILDAIIVLGTVGASVVAYRFEHLSTRAFMLVLAAAGIFLAAGARLSGAAGIALMAAFFALVKLVETVYDGKLQHNITGRLRATVTSVGGLAAELLGICFYLIFGYTAAADGTLAAFEIFGFLVVAVASIYFVLGRRLLRI